MDSGLSAADLRLRDPAAVAQFVRQFDGATRLRRSLWSIIIFFGTVSPSLSPES